MSLPETQTTTTAASNYKAVREKIERERLAPWGSAVGVKIGDFTVEPMSFRSLTDLDIAGNAFATGDAPTPGDIAAYIWRHMPEYSPSADSREFIRRIASSKNVYELMAGIWEHFSIAFKEPPVSSTFGGVLTVNSLPAIPNIASICAEYGAAFGVDPQDVADIDLRIVFQCCRALRMRNGDKFSEPKELREAKSNFLKSHGKN